jgi:HNH endonuclease
MTPQERFWSKVERGEGCWLWVGPLHPAGYGRFRLDGQNHPAHRVACEWANGAISHGQHLHHTCGNRACVRPAHLVPLTERGRWPPNTAEVFWERVARGEPAACWLWTGTINVQGYGVFKYQRSFWQTHRLAWTLACGEIPTGLCVLHRCDVPLCCNPAHLFLGTQAENVADKVAKGRQSRGDAHWRRHPERIARGEHLPQHRLSEKDVRAIRLLYEAGIYTYPELAQLFCCSTQAVANVVLRRTWTHVP